MSNPRGRKAGAVAQSEVGLCFARRLLAMCRGPFPFPSDTFQVVRVKRSHTFCPESNCKTQSQCPFSSYATGGVICSEKGKHRSGCCCCEHAPSELPVTHFGNSNPCPPPPSISLQKPSFPPVEEGGGHHLCEIYQRLPGEQSRVKPPKGQAWGVAAKSTSSPLPTRKLPDVYI